MELSDSGTGVIGCKAHRAFGIVPTGRIPPARHLAAEQPPLEPAILHPRQMPHDAGDRHVRGRQQTLRRLLPRDVDQSSGSDRSVLVESLEQCRALILRLQIWVGRFDDKCIR